METALTILIYIVAGVVGISFLIGIGFLALTIYVLGKR